MHTPATPVVYETVLLKCWFDENGILQSISKPAERSIANYNHLFELYKQLSKNGTQKFCTLGNISKTQELHKEVREYIATQLPLYVKAMALVSETPMGKTIGKIFTAVHENPYPTAIFDDRNEAQKWLEQFL
jgi:hypothetical protein